MKIFSFRYDIRPNNSPDSVILLEQIRTIDKSRLRGRMGRLDAGTMSAVDNALAVSFGLGSL